MKVPDFEKFASVPKGHYEYKLVIPVAEELRRRIHAALEEHVMVENFSGTEIFLAGFYSNEEMENTLGRWLLKICQELGSMRITLCNIGLSPAGKIFLKILDDTPIRKIKNQVKMMNACITSTRSEYSAHFHLEVCQVSPERFSHHSMQELIMHQFHEAFDATSIALYRRITSASSFQLVNSFQLPGSEWIRKDQPCLS